MADIVKLQYNLERKENVIVYFFDPDFLLQQNQYADVYVYVSRDKDLVMHSSVTYTFTFTSVHTRTMMVTVMVMWWWWWCDMLVTVVVKVMGIDEIHKIHYLPMYLPGHVESTHPSLHTCSMKWTRQWWPISALKEGKQGQKVDELKTMRIVFSSVLYYHASTVAELHRGGRSYGTITQRATWGTVQGPLQLHGNVAGRHVWM